MSLVILVFALLFTEIVSDDCPPCKCQHYYVSAITCSPETVDFFHPLKSVPAINYSKPVKWDEMYIKQQPLKNIPANAFEKAGLVHLGSISVTNCDLETVDKNAFKNVTNLVDLDLSFNILSELDNKTFRHTIYIKYLKLNYNKLTSINDQIFKDLTKLEILEITNNSLTIFDEKSLLHNKILKQLHLSNNKLTSLNIDQLKTKTKFSILKIAGNPWVCDCYLKDLLTYIVNKFRTDGSNYEKELTGTYCTAPKFDIPWRRLKAENFTCWLFSRPDNKKVKAKVENSVKLSCIIDSNAPPNVTWLFNNQIVNTTHKKYKSNIVQLHEATYNYSLQIRDLTKYDQGKYKCLLENSLANQSTEAEITLKLEKEPVDVILIIIVSGLVLFLVCVLALLFKCIIKCSILTNLSGDQPKFDDYVDDISIHSSNCDYSRNVQKSR